MAVKEPGNCPHRHGSGDDLERRHQGCDGWRLWQRHIWEPMLESLVSPLADGGLCSDVDVEVLARAVHCLHVGYFLTRCVFAPDLQMGRRQRNRADGGYPGQWREQQIREQAQKIQ